MTDLEHEQVFFEFVKNHDLLQHITYSEKSIKDQKVIGILIDDDNVINRGASRTQKILVRVLNQSLQNYALN